MPPALSPGSACELDPVANSFDMSVPVGSLKKASVRLDWFWAITSSGSGRTTLWLQR